MNSTSALPISASLLGPISVQYPFYHLARADVLPGLSDKHLSIIAPFVAYWLGSLLFQLLDSLALPALERYRIHEPEEVKTRNRVTMRQVIVMVLFQQVLQTAMGLYWLEDDDPASGPFRDHQAEIGRHALLIANALSAVLPAATLAELNKTGLTNTLANASYWWAVPVAQFFFAAFVLDAWQYAWHRYFHVNSFLYRHIHSWHHRLYVPYAFGALYNHPVEGFTLDTLGAMVAHTCAGLTTRQAILFFAISTAKTVDDHCGFSFPYDPLQWVFSNNADYHDIHHQIAGLKKNFSQPYFIHFDRLLGTRMTRAEFNAKKWKRRAQTDDEGKKDPTVPDRLKQE